MPLIQEEIWTVAEQLQEQGQRPTLAAVRGKLGGGSYTTISEALKVWREKKREVEEAKVIPPPESVVSSTRALVSQIWDQAQKAAQGQLEEQHKALKEAKSRFQKEQQELTLLADSLSAELEAAKNNLEKIRSEAESKQAQLQGELQEERRRLSEAKEHLARLSGEIETERKHASEAIDRTHREGQRAAIAEARVAELEREIESLRRQIANKDGR
jgi:chromosome segregation ATPase